MGSIYDYIEAMRVRPGMFTSDLSLAPLETLLQGYCTCLNANQIKEVYDGRTFDPGEFSRWIYEEMGSSGALGFAHAIDENTHGAEASFDMFFKLVQRFRYGAAPVKV